METQRIICKVDLDGDMRRFPLTGAAPQYSEVLEQVRAKFALSEDACYRLVFTDPDGDAVTVSSNESLADAISCAHGSAVVRLQLVPASTPLFKAAPASSSSGDDNDKAVAAARRQLRVIKMRIAHLTAKEQMHHMQHARMEAHKAAIVQKRASLMQAEAELLAQFPQLATDNNNEDVPPCHPFRFRRGFFPHRHFFAEQQQGEEGQAERPFPRGPNHRFRRCEEEEGAPRTCPRFSADMSVVTCDDCQQVIAKTDVRFKCADCPNFDLCATCEAKTSHDPAHPLLKLKPEAQARFPHLPCHRPLMAGFLRRAQFRTFFDAARQEKVDATEGQEHPFFSRCPRFRRRQCEPKAAEEQKPQAEDSFQELNNLFDKLIQHVELPSCIDAKAIFNQVLQTVKSVQPEILRGLPELAKEMASKPHVDPEEILPQLASFAESKMHLLNPEVFSSLIQGVTPIIQQALPAMLASGLQQAAPEIFAFFGMNNQPATPQPPAPEAESPDYSPLAALSIPPEILQNLINLAQNPQEVLAMWEAMQD